MKKHLIFIGLIFSFTTHAFTLNSTNDSDLKGWENETVEFRVNDSNCPANVDVEGIIKDAVEVWNNVPTSSIKAIYGGSTTSTTFASPPTVYCETNFNSATNADENYVPGAAAVQKPNGQIISGVLYLNVSTGLANISNMDREILTIILAHEIGHILGLGHSDDTKALMYYDATAKQTLSLGQDDIDGISYLYPSDEFQEGKYLGCALIKSLPPPQNRDIFIYLLLMILPFLIWFICFKKTKKISYI